MLTLPHRFYHGLRFYQLVCILLSSSSCRSCRTLRTSKEEISHCMYVSTLMYVSKRPLRFWQRILRLHRIEVLVICCDNYSSNNSADWQSKVKRNSVCHHERPRHHRCFHQHHFSVLGGHQCYRSTGVLVKCDLNKPSTSTTMSKMCLLLCSCGHQLRPGRA